jgi:hypothetical protein
MCVAVMVQKIDKDYKARMEKIAEVEKESVQAGGADGAPAGPGSGVAGSGGGGGGSSSGEQASSWLDHHEPVNVYDEMDWIAHRSRAELRGKCCNRHPLLAQQAVVASSRAERVCGCACGAAYNTSQ